MIVLNSYAIAKEQYANVGVDTEKALDLLERTPLSVSYTHLTLPTILRV